MFLTVPWLLAGALFAWAEAFAGVRWTFANSEMLSLVPTGDNAGVYRGADEETRLLAGPLRETTLDRTNLRFPSNRGFVATTDEGLFVISETGRVSPIPLMNPPHRDASRRIAWRYLASMEHDGAGFIVLHVEWRDPVPTGPNLFDGELLVLRDDGAFVRFAATLATDPPSIAKTTFRDGLLRVEGYPRAVDFDQFDLETTIRTGIARVASEGQQAVLSGWARAVEVFGKFDPRERPRFVGTAARDAVEGAFGVLRRRRGGVILRGPTGVGKEFVARQIVRRLPRGWTAFEVTPDGIASTSGLAGGFEARLSVMKAAAETRPTVWILRNVAAFRGTGTHSKKDTDFFDGVLPEVADGTLRVIGLCDEPQYAALVRGRDDVRAAFEVVPVAGADDQAVREATLQKLARQDLEIGQNAFAQLRRWGARFGPRQTEPGRTLSLVGAAAQRAVARGATRVLTEDAREAVEASLGVPPEYLDHDQALATLDRLTTNLAARLPGNDDARALMVAAARAVLFDLRAPDRPRATGLLLGPKGAGKTALIEVYAEELGRPLLALGMGEFAHAWHLDKFLKAFGEFLDANPLGIVFLDELDKAAPEVQNALLKALESNAFTFAGDKGLTSVPMVNAQIFAASNAGEDMISTAAAQGHRVVESALRAGTTGRLSEYLVDRMDFVAPVYPSDDRAYRLIVRGTVREALAHFDIAPERVSNFGDMIERLVAERPPRGSNREAERAVTRTIRDAIGELLAMRRVRPETLAEARFRFADRLELDCVEALTSTDSVVRATFGRLPAVVAAERE